MIIPFDDINSPITHIDYRSTLYYGKYVYRLEIIVHHAAATRYLSSRKAIYESLMKPYGFYSMRNESKLYIETTLDNLCQFAKKVRELKKNKLGTVRIEYSTVTVFVNDIDNLLPFIQFSTSPMNKHKISKCESQNAADVKYTIRQPKNKWRIHFRESRVPVGFQQDLKEFLETKDYLKPSSSLVKWLNQHSARYLRSYFYIDYNDENIRSYIALVWGEWLGKHYTLKQFNKIENPS